MRISALGIALIAALHVYHVVAAPRVAVIGGGMGGTGTAYFINERCENAEITLYEASERLGGRVQDIDIEGKRVELGASIFHIVNKHMVEMAARFGLETKKASGNMLGIWDGKEFVFREKETKWETMAGFLWRYGLSPVVMKLETDRLLDGFLGLYEHINGTGYASIQEMLGSFGGLEHVAKSTGDFFDSTWATRRFTEELVGAVTRVNYHANLELNAFAGLVSLVGAEPQLYRVVNGNARIAENMAKASGATVKLSTPVKEIKRNESSYTIDGVEYDAVVIAAPLESLPGVDFTGLPVHTQYKRQYRNVHVTFIVGNLSTTYFGANPPDEVLTTHNAPTLFMSIGAQGLTAAGHRIFKIFSSTPMEAATLNTLFEAGYRVAFTHLWQAYPTLPPTRDFHDIVLGPRLYYANALETAVSTMETSIMSGQNIAALIAGELCGARKESKSKTGQSEL